MDYGNLTGEMCEMNVWSLFAAIKHLTKLYENGQFLKRFLKILYVYTIFEISIYPPLHQHKLIIS